MTPIIVILAIVVFFAIIGITILVAHLSFLRTVDRCMRKHEVQRAANPEDMSVNSEPGVPLINI